MILRLTESETCLEKRNGQCVYLQFQPCPRDVRGVLQDRASIVMETRRDEICETNFGQIPSREPANLASQERFRCGVPAELRHHISLWIVSRSNLRFENMGNIHLRGEIPQPHNNLEMKIQQSSPRRTRPPAFGPYMSSWYQEPARNQPPANAVHPSMHLVD